MKIKFNFIGLAILLFAGNLFGQDSLIHQTVFPKGISVDYGLGRYSVRDKYISKNKYSGSISSLNVTWSHFNKHRGVRLIFDYRSDSEIKNYNLSTRIKEFSFTGAYIYSIGTFNLFSKKVYTYLGPSWDFYLHARNQNMASHMMATTLSYATLISVGLNSEFICPIKPKLQVEGSLGLSLLSLAGRLPDLETEEAKMIKLLPFYSAMKGYSTVAFRYNFMKKLSCRMGYQFRFIWFKSSTRWETEDGWYGLAVANDNIFLGLTWNIGGAE
jgi:hypothetical protein